MDKIPHLKLEICRFETEDVITMHLSTKTGHDKKINRHCKWLAEQHLRKSVQVIRHPLTEPERNAGQECRR